MKKSDEQLIVGYLNGDESAFPVLVKRYLKQIYNFAERMTGSRENAEDIAQETFLKVWKNLKKFRQGESFKTWVYAIARNTAIDWLRKRRSMAFSDFEKKGEENYFEKNLPDLAPLPEETMKKAEDTEFLNGILNKLSPLYLEVLILHYQNDLTFDEIGKILGKSLNTVKSQHIRALGRLRKLLNEIKLGNNTY